MVKKRIIIIGAGAAGCFAAASLSDLDVLLLEKTQVPLAKVRISGGGRCNVTHSCFDPLKLVQNYPRGMKALKGPFSKFQPKDTIDWFESRGVSLKTEEDGRIFPKTDKSETIISCLLQEMQKNKVEIRKGEEVVLLEKKDNEFLVHLHSQEILKADFVIISTGSNAKGHLLAKSLGHTIVAPVPSLFTFVIKDERLEGLSGISVENVHLSIEGTSLQERGPLLITHWGVSGPAVLKLSAWGARALHTLNYHAVLKVKWLEENEEGLKNTLLRKKQYEGKKAVHADHPFSLPKNLYRRLLQSAGIAENRLYAQLSSKEISALLEQLLRSRFQIEGKSTYKDEFVTCGGVDLNEVHFQTMESKLIPGLYFAGEVLDIDGVTGGFNFQNAWTTATLAANSIISQAALSHPHLVLSE